MLERLQKILSARGIASRRKAEEYIQQGLVTVNGEVATLGQKADPEHDRIEVDGKVLQSRQTMLYYLLCKPVGVVTTNLDTEAPPAPRRGGKKEFSSLPRATPEPSVPTVRDLLPRELQGRVFPVGRLDKDTSGLLLLTNDGVLAYRLTHPKFYHEKEYEVTVDPPIKDGALRKLAEGVMLDGAKTKEATIRRLSPTSFRIALTEGRNRQIRRMCKKVGSDVVRLRRIRIVTLKDETLKPGQIRALTQAERERLLEEVGAASGINP